MAQRISRSSPHLRLAKDSLWPSPPQRCQHECRRAFSAYHRLNAKGMGIAKKQQAPARPSMGSLQAQHGKNLRKEDLPDDMGLVRLTYILPPNPSMFKNPRLRLSQLYEFTSQFFKDMVQIVYANFTFWSNVPEHRRPANLKKLWLPFRPIWIPLDTFSAARIAKDLHTRSYKALEHAVKTGKIDEIRRYCGKDLEEKYIRQAQKHKIGDNLVRWSVKYGLGPRAVFVLSRKFGQVPITFGGLPVGQQQILARIQSEQTMEIGRILGRTKDGEQDIEWRKPKTRKLTEYMILSRMYLEGKFTPWKVFSFKHPKGTQEELDEWREDQLKIPDQQGMF